MIAFTIPNIAGTITLLCVAPNPSTRGGLIVAFYCMQVFQAVRHILPCLDLILCPRNGCI